MTNTPAVRTVRYGIGMKFGLFIALILVVTMLIVGFFVVKNQAAGLRQNLEESMTAALVGYRDLVRRNLEEVIKTGADPVKQAEMWQRARRQIREYTDSLTNIKNCVRAVFTEGAVTGLSIADSGQGGDTVWTEMTDKTRYERIDYFLTDMIDDSRPRFTDTVTTTNSRYHLESIRTYNTWVSNRNVLIRKLNDERRRKNLPLLREEPFRSPREMRGFSEGIMQVYVNYHKLLFPSGRDHLREGLALYHAWRARGYDFSGVQSPGRVAGLRFAALVKRATGLLFQEDGKGTVRPGVWSGILEKRRKDPIPAGEQQWLFAFSRQLDAYREPDVRGLLQYVTALQAFLVRFPELADRTNVFPGADLWQRDVLRQLPSPDALPGLAEVPAVYAGAYRQHLDAYRRLRDGVLRPATLFPREAQERAARLLELMFREPWLARAAGLDDAGRAVLRQAAAGGLFRTGLTTREALEIHTARTYADIAGLFHADKPDPEWEKALRRIVPWFSWRGHGPDRIPVPFYRDDEIGMHLKFFAGYFREFMESGIFPRKFPHNDSWEFLRLSRLVKNGRAYRAAGTAEERAEFFRHVLRCGVAPFKLGFVRIMLATDSLRRDRNQVTYRTADLGISLVLRMVFFSFLLSGLFVRNIRRLADAARRVGQGDLQTRIELATTDELGQLADQFNVMVAEVRESQAQMVEKSRMEEELKIAEQIQQALLPETFPQVAGVSFAGYYNAMTEAGGDYYDVLEVGEGLYGLVSADVSGHGVGAGLVMTMMRSILHAQAPGILQAQTVLRKINPQLHKDTPDGVFVTALYGVLDVNKRELSYASAGHDPCLLYNKAKGICQYLEAEGVPLGMFDTATFEGILKGYKLKLSPGDTVVFYTDGVTEAMNAAREEYQDERLAEVVRKNGALPPEELVRAIVDDVRAFTGGLPQEDDISLLVFRMD